MLGRNPEKAATTGANAPSNTGRKTNAPGTSAGATPAQASTSAPPVPTGTPSNPHTANPSDITTTNPTSIETNPAVLTTPMAPTVQTTTLITQTVSFSNNNNTTRLGTTYLPPVIRHIPAYPRTYAPTHARTHMHKRRRKTHGHSRRREPVYQAPIATQGATTVPQPTRTYVLDNALRHAYVEDDDSTQSSPGSHSEENSLSSTDLYDGYRATPYVNPFSANSALYRAHRRQQSFATIQYPAEPMGAAINPANPTNPSNVRPQQNMQNMQS
ncbi:uncharacterized protein DFL_001107 [Arthrobotrys flagrans]|uniref:Uncharacterized protein n=1 Tax=Arthrobotrys flagrans TaxID=97331 RepID=A0A437AG80_ARTFL|nr:hypothetical protein DFL_001107 [Arthrobotrys flagrans]